MKTSVIEFKVMELPHQIEANVSRMEYMKDFQPFEHYHIQLLGNSDTSLITIHEAAEYLDFKPDVTFEWNFTKTDSLESDILLAVIHAN